MICQSTIEIMMELNKQFFHFMISYIVLALAEFEKIVHGAPVSPTLCSQHAEREELGRFIISGGCRFYALMTLGIY